MAGWQGNVALMMQLVLWYVITELILLMPLHAVCWRILGSRIAHAWFSELNIEVTDCLDRWIVVIAICGHCISGVGILNHIERGLYKMKYWNISWMIFIQYCNMWPSHIWIKGYWITLLQIFGRPIFNTWFYPVSQRDSEMAYNIRRLAGWCLVDIGICGHRVSGLGILKHMRSIIGYAYLVLSECG